jgi:uncharacterized iron-regulated membrane protein
MRTKPIRNWIFILHRYLGLAIGLITIIIGLTGSLLVFHSEISEFQQHLQIGTISVQGEPLPVESILNAVKSGYANQPEAILQMIDAPRKPSRPFSVAYSTPKNDWIETYVHPYTGAILGTSLQSNWVERSFDMIYELHYALLAGDVGLKLVGIVGLFMCILTVTGVLLWPGWRKLITGFKVKWNAHPKRVNFDVHKLVGIVTGIFLFLTFFTGLCWNFYEIADPLIYAVTFSPTPVEPVSNPVVGRSPLSLTTQLETAQAILPNATLERVYFPQKPEESLRFRFKLPQEKGDYGNSNVYLDPYSGQVLRVDNALHLSLGDRVLNAFTPLHYGTFGGLPTRIIYVFVGFAPLILFITGFVMWKYRRQKTEEASKKFRGGNIF